MLFGSLAVSVFLAVLAVAVACACAVAVLLWRRVVRLERELEGLLGLPGSRSDEHAERLERLEGEFARLAAATETVRALADAGRLNKELARLDHLEQALARSPLTKLTDQIDALLSRSTERDIPKISYRSGAPSGTSSSPISSR